MSATYAERTLAAAYTPPFARTCRRIEARCLAQFRKPPFRILSEKLASRARGRATPGGIGAFFR